jgi:hypothetical protein
MSNTPAVPRVPFINDDGRYDSAASTNVAATLARERKRIGALTGAQVRADRAARAKAARDANSKAQQPLELVTASPTATDVVDNLSTWPSLSRRRLKNVVCP